MNDELEGLAREIGLDAPEQQPLRLRFGHACALRVQHLLEDPAAAACLSVLGRHLEGSASAHELQQQAAEAALLARRHEGSRSIDGCGHAAVSATHAVARALAGKALEAAAYAAYASVYGGGGYGAVADRRSFEPEFSWQVDRLRSLARAQAAAPGAPGPEPGAAGPGR